MDTKAIAGKPLAEALNDELLETIDEELELEFDDQRLDSVVGRVAPGVATEALDRRTYFRELLRLQGELIKLQDWVVHQKLKLVVLFEGPRRRRQGRRHQAHHPAAQPACLQGRGALGPDRARTHPVVFSALRLTPAGRRRNRPVRPELVQPRRR
jgi:hypothetical protein